MSDFDEGQSQSADLRWPGTPKVRGVLVEWRDRADAASKTHYAMANRLSRLNMILGIPVVVLTTLVGTSVFATLQEAVNTRMRIIAGFAIVLAAVLASLQTFLSSAERAEKNWTAAEMCSAIRREITEMLALHPAYTEARDDPKQYLDGLRTRMDEVAKESPGMPNHLWARISSGWATTNPWTPTWTAERSRDHHSTGSKGAGWRGHGPHVIRDPAAAVRRC